MSFSKRLLKVLAFALVASLLWCEADYVFYGTEPAAYAASKKKAAKKKAAAKNNTQKQATSKFPTIAEALQIYLTRNNNDIALIRQKAQNGDIEAQLNMGRLYNLGRPENDIPQDKEEAKRWYRVAAEKGNAMAQNNLGALLKSEGFDTQATGWYRKAAENGLALARVNLGLCYYYGDGVTRNLSEAERWFRASAEQGHPNGQFWLGYFYEEIRGDTEKAIVWWRKAVQQGHKEAESKLNIAEYNLELKKAQREQEKARQEQLNSLIETARNLHYSEWPPSVGYLPVGKQLEKVFSDTSWHAETDSNGKPLAVFEGTGRYDGRRARYKVKFAENEGICSIYVNDTEIYNSLADLFGDFRPEVGGKQVLKAFLDGIYRYD